MKKKMKWNEIKKFQPTDNNNQIMNESIVVVRKQNKNHTYIEHTEILKFRFFSVSHGKNIK